MDIQVPYVPTALTQRPVTLNLTFNVINYNVRKSKVKCLFGKSDPLDTQRMLEDQYQQDKTRLCERFGIDIEDIENERIMCNVQNIGSCQQRTSRVNPKEAKITSKNILHC